MSRTEINIEESIRNYIVKSFLPDGEAATLSNDADLLTTLDSLQILRLLLDLEAEYSMKVENEEMTPENIGTVERLAAFIGRKRQAAVCQGAR